MSGSGVSLREREGFEIWLWREKAPPIVISPFLDRRGNSGLPSISQMAFSSSAKAPVVINNKITQRWSHIFYKEVQMQSQW